MWQPLGNLGVSRGDGVMWQPLGNLGVSRGDGVICMKVSIMLRGIKG